MKIKGGLLYLFIFLTAALTTTTAIASPIHTENRLKIPHNTNIGFITLDFIDATGPYILIKEICITKNEWRALQNELSHIPTNNPSLQETLNAQLAVFKRHQLISSDITAETLLHKNTQKINQEKFTRIQQRTTPTPLLNNTIFNGMCAINFVLKNGTTAVLGLNSFINWIGFDIASVHIGNMTSGIQTNGLISRSVPPGKYVGFMFGFLGYWLGEKVITGIYTNLTAAGFTVLTVWLPIPLFPKK